MEQKQDHEGSKLEKIDRFSQQMHSHHSRHYQRPAMETAHSAAELASAFGMTETVDNMLITHRLRWLGHVGRMGPERLPKQLLFGEFFKVRPPHGTRKRWRDCITADLKATGIDGWYEMSQDRDVWRRRCLEKIEERRMNKTVEPHGFLCVCGRSFRRSSDRTRHHRYCTDWQAHHVNTVGQV